MKFFSVNLNYGANVKLLDITE